VKTSQALLLLLLLTPSAALDAQEAGTGNPARFFGITLGLGVGEQSAPALVNYISAVARPRIDERLDEFNTVVKFSIYPELQVADEWSVGLEYGLLLKSYSLTDRSGLLRTDISYQVHMPTVLVQYLVSGEGYRLKAGGGIGYHIARFTQGFPTYGTEESFHTGGPGVKLGAVGNTRFDETFYGSIGVDLQWDFLGALKRGDGSEVVDKATGMTPRMNLFTVSLTFGVMFQL
jgi:hypothetical protein